MKYTILISQKTIIDAGLGEDTNLVDWAIIDYIQKFQTSPKSKRLGDYVWINLKTLILEMPLLGLPTKQAVSRRLSKLRSLGLIESKYDESSRHYCRITEKCYRAITSEHVSDEETKGGKRKRNGGKRNDDEGVNENATGGKRNDDIKQTNNKQTNNEPEYPLNESAWATWLDYRKRSKFKPYATDRAINLLRAYPEDIQELTIDHSITNQYQGLFPEKFRPDQNQSSQNHQPPHNGYAYV